MAYLCNTFQHVVFQGEQLDKYAMQIEYGLSYYVQVWVRITGP